MGETSQGMASRVLPVPARRRSVCSWSLMRCSLGVRCAGRCRAVVCWCFVGDPGLSAADWSDGGFVLGQQKTPWPEAQEVAGERDVAFAVR